MYRVELSENALKTFRKMDKQIATMIFAWISKNLEGCEMDISFLWSHLSGDD
jgi:mRNA-degrading endonuclease RelE of RelBE toxin-antitoxin system